MKEHFNVTHVKGFGLLFWILVTVIVFICIIQSFTNGIEPLMYISFAVLVLPFAIALIWFKRYKIIVDKNKITVRRGFGTKYTVDVSEITKVKWFIRYNPFMAPSPKGRINKNKITKLLVQNNQLVKAYSNGEIINENIIIKTRNRRFTVSTLMDGFKEMSEYLKAHVDFDKIEFK